MNLAQFSIEKSRITLVVLVAILVMGLEVQRVASLDRYIDEKVGSFVVNLLQAVAIVLAVMLLFLGVRTGLVIASLVPIVTITTLMLIGGIWRWAKPSDFGRPHHGSGHDGGQRDRSGRVGGGEDGGGSSPEAGSD